MANRGDDVAKLVIATLLCSVAGRAIETCVGRRRVQGRPGRRHPNMADEGATQRDGIGKAAFFGASRPGSRRRRARRNGPVRS